MTNPKLRGFKLRYASGFTGVGGGPNPATLKNPIKGLVARNLTDVQSRPSDLRGVVAEMDWADMQTTNGGALNTSNASWTNLTNCKATGLPVRLRVFTGAAAPTWAKNLNGGPLSVIEPTGDPSAILTVPLWWKTSYLAAWEDFMTKLAVLLNDDEQVREVAAPPAIYNAFAEPLQRGTSKTLAVGGPNSGKSNVEVYTAAGLAGGTSTTADPQDKTAIEYPFALVSGIPRWQSLGWTKTRFYHAYTPYQSWKLNAASPRGFDAVTDPGGFTGNLINFADTNMGDLMMHANNSWRVQMLSGKYPLMYSNLQAASKPWSMQTATLARMLDAYNIVFPAATSQQLALKAGLDTACGIFFDPGSDPNNYVLSPATLIRPYSIELPSGWSPHLSGADCSTYNGLLEAA
jgi:hypothetical protein